MDRCPHCSFPYYGYALECAKCHFPLAQGGVLCVTSRAPLVGPRKAQDIRKKALAALALGLLLKVYWGGHGPWPVVTEPTMISLRHWFEPLLVDGGIIGYALGWFLAWF